MKTELCFISDLFGMLCLKFECMRVCLLLVSAVSQFAGQSRQMLVNYIEKFQSDNGEMKFQCGEILVVLEEVILEGFDPRVDLNL